MEPSTVPFYSRPRPRSEPYIMEIVNDECLSRRLSNLAYVVVADRTWLNVFSITIVLLEC